MVKFIQSIITYIHLNAFRPMYLGNVFHHESCVFKTACQVKNSQNILNPCNLFHSVAV